MTSTARIARRSYRARSDEDQALLRSSKGLRTLEPFSPSLPRRSSTLSAHRSDTGKDIDTLLWGWEKQLVASKAFFHLTLSRLENGNSLVGTKGIAIQSFLFIVVDGKIDRIN
jgi:hypothetical protein